jgi:hypothetical protein
MKVCYINCCVDGVIILFNKYFSLSSAYTELMRCANHQHFERSIYVTLPGVPQLSSGWSRPGSSFPC